VLSFAVDLPGSLSGSVMALACPEHNLDAPLGREWGKKLDEREVT
jgi:hypothetical protein